MHEGRDRRVDDRLAHAERLHADLRRVAEEQAVGARLHAFGANTPVSSAPVMPPTPCAATTSSESSSRVRERQRIAK